MKKMKKICLAVLAVVVLAVVAFAFTACSNSSRVSVDGTYYLYKNNALVKNDWLKLKDGKWNDSDDANGTYEYEDGKIVFYVEFFGSGEVLARGTVADGVITLTNGFETSIYCKEGKTPPSTPTDPNTPNNPNNPNTPNTPTTPTDPNTPSTPTKNYMTVKFNLNGGSGTLKDMQFAVGEVMSALPSPTRDEYIFVCWIDAFDGMEYTAASVMPNSDLSLTAMWQKKVTNYKDDYVSLAPASVGYKSSFIQETYRKQVDKFVYVEITSDDLSGKVGEDNNFTLRTMESMKYQVNSGYTWAWYQGDFNNPNGAQRFRLDYGSNIQFVTISDNSGVVVQTYLLDIYVKHDYYISLYKNIFEEEPYDKVRVIENDRFSAATKTASSKYEFESRVYYNSSTYTYENFVYTTAITRNWDLYQTYKEVTVNAELDGGVLEEDLVVKPYTKYFTLPSPEKEGYDFLGWKLPSGKYLTNVQGYSGVNCLSEDNKPEKLTATYAKKKYYYTFEDDVLKTQKTVPVVTYTDSTMTEILEVSYTPYGTDCVLPTKTAQSDGEIFIGWQYYHKSNDKFGTNLTSYDFDNKIIAPLALCPHTVTSNNAVVPLNGELTSNKSGTYRMYLPANRRYQLTISATNSVTLTVNKYGSTENSKTVTVKSGEPTTLNLDYYVYNLGAEVYSHGYVTFEVTSLSGSFTARLSGLTAITSGSPVTLSKDNSAEAGDEITLPLDNPGYTFAGLYEGNEKVSDNEKVIMSNRETEISVKWIKVTITSEDTNMGTVSALTNTYKSGDRVTVTATTKMGYTFIGWFNGNTKLTEELSYTFTMPSESEAYIAKWIKVNVINNDTIMGTVTFLTSTYMLGDSVTITAIARGGYTFIGWYDGDAKLTGEQSYTFKMPSVNTTYTAKFEERNRQEYLDEVFIYTESDGAYTITGIKDKAVKEISVPAYVTNIASGAFAGCSNLESITLPFVGDKVKSVADKYQYPLGYIFGTDSYDGGTATKQSYYGSSTSWSEGTINTSYYIPSTLRNVTVTGGNILHGAFYNCSSLTSITIPDSVTSIGDYAFYKCSSLTSIKIPDSVTSIGEGVFRDCSSLTSITIPDSVTSIKKYAFYCCSSLTSITIPDGVTSIGQYAFYCCSLESITIPYSVTSIGGYAFSGCSSLTSAIFENTFGWKWETWDRNGLIDSSSLANTLTAAKYLKNNYSYTHWYQ